METNSIQLSVSEWCPCLTIIQLFRERLSEKMCTRQSRKVIWDVINTLFLTLWLSNLLLLLSFSTHRHMSMASPAIVSNFFEKQWTQDHPCYISGVVACTLSDNLSRNSCVEFSFSRMIGKLPRRDLHPVCRLNKKKPFYKDRTSVAESIFCWQVSSKPQAPCLLKVRNKALLSAVRTLTFSWQ